MLISILLATTAVSLLSFSGSFLLLKEKLLAQKTIPYFVSFAAGVLLATSFFDLMPEAVELSGTEISFLPVLLGIVTFFFLERFVLWFHHHDEPHGPDPSALLVLVGDGVHNFIDGVAIAATFLTSPSLGVATSLAIAAHEIPHEVADFTVLIHGGMKKGIALLYNFFSGLTAILGAVAGFLFLSAVTQLLPALLSFSAGMFIYIACSDLIPDMHKDFTKQKGWTQVLPFIGGMLLTYVSIQLLAH